MASLSLADNNRVDAFAVIIDGILLSEGGQLLQPPQFFDAIESDGRHELLTCECGEFACGGSYVRTNATASGWQWVIEHEPPALHEFDWESVLHTAESIVTLIRTRRGSRFKRLRPELPRYQDTIERIRNAHTA